MSGPIPVTLLVGVPPAPLIRLVEYLVSAPSPLALAVISDVHVGRPAVTLTYWADGAWHTSAEMDHAAALRRHLEIASRTERLVINTISVGPPALARLLLADPLLSASYALDETVAVLDLNSAPSLAAMVSAAAALIRQADKVLLTSLRRTARQRFNTLVSHMRPLNEHAPIFEATGADIQLAGLLNVTGTRGDAQLGYNR